MLKMEAKYLVEDKNDTEKKCNRIYGLMLLNLVYITKYITSHNYQNSFQLPCLSNFLSVILEE